MKFTDALFITTILLYGTNLIAQEQIKIHHGCNFSGVEGENEYYSFDPSNEASRIVYNILQAMGGLSSKSFTLKESNVTNAIATVENGQRYILYNAIFLEKFKGDAKTKWAAYTVIAHEIGHHLNNHNFAEQDPRKRKVMELEADKFAGAVCRTLGATLDETLAGMESMNLPGETATHPPKSARTAAIANGWKGQDELLKASQAIDNQLDLSSVDKKAKTGYNSTPSNLAIFDGEWHSRNFNYSFRIKNKIGVATLSNSSDYSVGDVMITIEDFDGEYFNASQIYTDGKWYKIKVKLLTNNCLMLKDSSTTWSMIKVD